MEFPEAGTNPLMIQGDHGPVALRNIYIRPLRSLRLFARQFARRVLPAVD